ncbi:MAG: hypothetical protein VXZ05_05630 [Pseudomonadota bacterium]|nr:hypothetical protein [Pseudomonadota bacterium]
MLLSACTEQNTPTDQTENTDMPSVYEQEDRSTETPVSETSASETPLSATSVSADSEIASSEIAASETGFPVSEVTSPETSFSEELSSDETDLNVTASSTGIADSDDTEMSAGSQTDAIELLHTNTTDTESAIETDESADVTDSGEVALDYDPLHELEENNNNSRQPLNLTLPSMNWEKTGKRMHDYGVLPDVFQRIQSDPSMNVSGKIHWDESEAARELSVEDTIKGAEVELQFYLP